NDKHDTDLTFKRIAAQFLTLSLIRFSKKSHSSLHYGLQFWVLYVFPSFSVEDIRQTFLSHFLKDLDRKLIIAFKDNETERSQSLNPDLKRAIRDSRIAIVIFSKNYASSSWCLNELLEIGRCKEDSNRLVVIPVFYGLDPSHVRKQIGNFGKIFKKTCQNRTEDEINLRRRALIDVANTLGYHSAICKANMTKEITNDVLVKLNLTPSNDIEDFEVRMVRIWGFYLVVSLVISKVVSS
ncbi:Toll/interleukin-1 receptor homology (TIR) domain, partial [Arabidopsis suecica]